jgi:hypothetical protein
VERDWPANSNTSGDTFGSPTSREQIAIEALARLAGPRAPEDSEASVDSILEKAMQLSSSR